MLENFILTRIGLQRFNDRRGREHARFDERLQLLMNICLPGLLAQTTQDFTWILLTDDKLPPDRLARLRDIARLRPRTIVHVSRDLREVKNLGWLAPYRERSPGPTLTTTLDSDDTLHPDFIALLHEAA